MRVLHANKFAYSKGGAEVYMLRTARQQQRRGHFVGIFGGRSSRLDISDSRIVSYDVDIPEFHDASGLGKVAAARDVIWSANAAGQFRSALQDFMPDVVHLHNYAHQLSPSIIKELQKLRIPHVYTAHDYKLVCPAYVANVKGKDCFACSNSISLKLLRDRCHHDSLTWSALVAMEAIEVRASGLFPKRIIAPSEFMLNAVQNSWLGRSSISTLLRNPADEGCPGWNGNGNYLLYVGRLSSEKGIIPLLEAAGALGLHVRLAGDGPLRAQLETDWEGAEVELLGHVGEAKLRELRRGCTAQVVPSTWPENAPLAALEAAADGVPLIVSRRGGLPELRGLGARVVEIDGLSAPAIASALEQLPSIAGDATRFAYETSWSRHLDGLDDIYAQAVGVS